MNIHEIPDFDKHEQIVFCNDHTTGLRAIVAIHNTQLGPALGGCRFYPYATTEDAVKDVLRLSKGMTYKAAVANLNLGGGKAVIIGDPKKLASEAFFRAFGRFVQGLGGRYITAEDVGTSTRYMDWISEETGYVTGISTCFGGSGDPSPFTAHGTFMGIKAAWKQVTGKDKLDRVKILVQGVGSVGYCLCRELHQAKAKLYVNDVNQEAVQRAVDEFGAEVVSEKELYGLKVDIYSPCALGATLNDKTIPQLKCTVIAGAANNQLAIPEKHSLALRKANILYAPDYVINAGGLINVYSEVRGGGSDYVFEQVENIYETLLNIFNTAEKGKITTHAAANKIAEQRMQAIAATKSIYLSPELE